MLSVEDRELSGRTADLRDRRWSATIVGMRCVVFGATGYLGGRLVPELVAAGHDVRHRRAGRRPHPLRVRHRARTDPHPRRRRADPLPTDPDWSGGSVYTDVRERRTTANPAELWAVIESIGGEHGWYQRAVFEPHGLAGHLCWKAIAPFHDIVFAGMARNITGTAERT